MTIILILAVGGWAFAGILILIAHRYFVSLMRTLSVLEEERKLHLEALMGWAEAIEILDRSRNIPVIMRTPVALAPLVEDLFNKAMRKP